MLFWGGYSKIRVDTKLPHMSKESYTILEREVGHRICIIASPLNVPGQLFAGQWDVGWAVDSCVTNAML